MAIKTLLTEDNYSYILLLLKKNPDAVTRLGNEIWTYHESHPESKALTVLTYIHNYGVEDLLYLCAHNILRHHHSSKSGCCRSKLYTHKRVHRHARLPIFINIDLHFHITNSGKIDFNAPEILEAIDRLGNFLEDRFGNLEADPSLGNVYQTVNKIYITPNEGNIQEDPDDPPTIDREKIRQDIIDWVNRLKYYVAQRWQSSYESLWQSIISLHLLEDQIYRPGKQKDVSFNRNLVANIICILKRKNVIYESNDTKLSKALKCNDAVRKNLNAEPSKEIKEAVVKLLTNDAPSE